MVFRSCYQGPKSEASRFTFSDVGIIYTCSYKPVLAVREEESIVLQELIQIIRIIVIIPADIDKALSLGMEINVKIISIKMRIEKVQNRLNKI